MLKRKDAAKLATALCLLFLRAPDEGERLAREYGLWDTLKEALAKPLHMAHCRKNPGLFIEYCFLDPEGKSVRQQPFQQEWQAMMSEDGYTMICAPRGHGKSTQILGRVVHEIGNNVNLRIKIVCATDDKAKELVSLVNEHISKNPHVRDVFPWLQIDSARGDTKKSFFVMRDIPQRDASVEGSGVMSAGAGGRADRLVCDDVVDFSNAIANPAQRPQVMNAINETWLPLISSTGKLWWICTPYHVLDATHQLRKTGLFRLWWVPAIRVEIITDSDGNAILDENGEPATVIHILWPDEWPEWKLRLKEAADARTFARQYQLTAMSEEERTFPDESLARSFQPELARMGENIPDDWATFAGIDLASALGKRNAYTVILTLAKNPDDGRLHFKDMVRRRIKFTETLEDIKAQFRHHKWAFVIVENNGYQSAVEDALKNDKDGIALPMKGLFTGNNKADEDSGLPGLNAALSRGAFAIPTAGKTGIRSDIFAETDMSPMAILFRELISYPGGEFKDCVMALWFAWRASIKGGGKFSYDYLEAMEQMADAA